LLVELPVAAVVALTEATGVEAVLAVGVVPAGVVAAVVPLIWAWTVALKVPVMPVRLFK
jgi:hypothetical protein